MNYRSRNGLSLLKWVIVACWLVVATHGVASEADIGVRAIPTPEELGAQAQVYRYSLEMEGRHTLKTLLIKLDSPRWILSTLQGLRHSSVAANHNVPPSLWGVLHDRQIADYTRVAFERLADMAGFSIVDLVRLSTGADLDTLGVATQRYDWLTVTVLATAGAGTNAMRVGTDYGDWFENKHVPRETGASESTSSEESIPFGTINVIVLTNASLGDAQMARSIITVTEAKTAVLQDLGIRSSYTPEAMATGTGTDEVMIVSGSGRSVTCAGGHCKPAQLIGWAAKEAVETALVRQIRLHYDGLTGEPPIKLPEQVLRHPLFRQGFTRPQYEPIAPAAKR
ncbi:MAG: adenosylcobinamide amidohydrolase [Deltaproteobacteria bacterium]|nr:adenosylcobinamide amidohydrolase [Deltaproteobacteria bacterium]